MKMGTKIFGGFAVVCLGYLLVGLLLPGRWTAREEILLPQPPSEVFPLLNSLLAWEVWTPFPEEGMESYGPQEGTGAGLRWDDPQYGRGEAVITGSTPNREVTYEVRIEGGSLTISGRLTLESGPEGTLLQWVEEGDFGWNPLMGYAARGMASSQGEAMRASLERLMEAANRREKAPTEGG